MTDSIASLELRLTTARSDSRWPRSLQLPSQPVSIAGVDGYTYGAQLLLTMLIAASGIVAGQVAMQMPGGPFLALAAFSTVALHAWAQGRTAPRWSDALLHRIGGRSDS